MMQSRNLRYFTCPGCATVTAVPRAAGDGGFEMAIEAHECVYHDIHAIDGSCEVYHHALQFSTTRVLRT